MNKKYDNLFSMVMPFRIAECGADLPRDYGDKLRAKFATLMQDSAEDFAYAIAAFIDESILASKWFFRDGWQVNTLQQQFFHEQLAGEGFFRRLEQLRRNPATNIELLEVYYACLQLGFRGVYLSQGRDKLSSLQNELLQQIETVRGGVDRCLSIDDSLGENSVTKLGRVIPIWVFMAVISVALFVIYLGFNLAIDHQANNIPAILANADHVILANAGI